MSEELATPESTECAQRIADIVHPTLDVILAYRARLSESELCDDAADEMTVELNALVFTLLFDPSDQPAPDPSGQPTGETPQ